MLGIFCTFELFKHVFFIFSGADLESILEDATTQTPKQWERMFFGVMIYLIMFVSRLFIFKNKFLDR